jgi:predicted secreted Zn-dependent protease
LTQPRDRRPPFPRWLVVLFATIAIAACGQTPSSPSAAAANPTGAPTSTASTPVTATPSQAAATARPAATPSPVAGPIAGLWRVRRVLAQDDRSALLPTTAYGDDAYDIHASCPNEPCDRIDVRAAPFGQAEPLTTATLDRDKADAPTYQSAATEAAGQCLTPDGNRVPGGASVKSTLRLWLASVRPAGTAIQSIQLQGRLDLDIAPTPIGTASGCERQTASYELTGRREAAAILPGQTDADTTDNPIPGSDGLVALPTISVKVPASTVDYFSVRGDTVDELVNAVARGGVTACGQIEYEWYRGDARPSACTQTNFSDLTASIQTASNSATGACRITSSKVGVTFTIHMPQWTAPKRVPAPLLAWWRAIVTFIRNHETGHTAISRDYVKQLNAKLDGAVCSSVNAIITKWAGQLSAAQEAYDRREYSKPWPVPPLGY